MKFPDSFRFLSRRAVRFTALLAAAAAVFAWCTLRSLQPLPESLDVQGTEVRRAAVTDRNGVPLSMTYQNRWNIHEVASLHELPALLQTAFVESEDRRFFRHGGVDWAARLHAAWQNLKALRAVRGASTITEQVVRLLHPRPRTVWSRWLEGFEAARLEDRFSKREILEFYLNQVPYANQRRGVVQAARCYFDRDPDTLSVRETLALAVLVRAPSGMDLRRETRALERGVKRLAEHLHAIGAISDEQFASAAGGRWTLAKPRLPVNADHFVRYLHQSGPAECRAGRGRLISTLDASVQEHTRRILDSRLKDLAGIDTANGAVLVVDHETDEVLAWVNGGAAQRDGADEWIDAVTAPRQPGSALKPFLYSLAMESGWTPATLIDDSPLAEAVGTGLHAFHNYSRVHYGPLRLRDALGNSLNIPAVRAIQYTGNARFLDRLHDLGFQSLTETADHYGDGLALGDGEVTLFELVQAYAVLARQGVFCPLRTVRGDVEAAAPPRRVFSEEISSLTANILSDPQARKLEFGDGNLLAFPVQTAVKTGTSGGHRDCWAVGFSSRYTVGVWMGNLDRRPTNGLTGARGPALVLRAVFAELNRNAETRPLAMSARLVPALICRTSGLKAGPHCPSMQEWFEREKTPGETCPLHAEPRAEGNAKELAAAGRKGGPRLLQPTPGLRLARDPRIPAELEAFAFTIPKHLKTQKVEWIVDGGVAGTTGPGEHRFLWPLSKGSHLAGARIWTEGDPAPSETPAVPFVVR
ncbi:MAG: transglycosylase domain-containing protein [Desulfobacteraceae bacterium]|nr:transglycosylase domain-containing protein [Desulfobacteraceae bacterium]